MKTVFTHPALYDEETGELNEYTFDAPLMVCPSCQGYGIEDRHDLDISRLIDNMEEDGDEEGIEDYFKGHYSETCHECKGRNVVPNTGYFLQSRPDLEAKIAAYYEEERQDRMYAAQERRAGA